MKRALLVVPLVFAALLVLPSTPAWACSCAAATTAQSVQRADVVVRGRLEAVEQPAGLHEPSSGGPAQSYRLAVTDVYRGAAAKTTWVGSAASGASCGLEGLQPGREYVVFAQERAGGLWASLCGGTNLADPALVAEVQAVSGAAHAPDLVPSGSATGQLPGATAPVSERGWLAPLLGGLALAVVLAAALVVVVRRGRRTA